MSETRKYARLLTRPRPLCAHAFSFALLVRHAAADFLAQCVTMKAAAVVFSTLFAAASAIDTPGTITIEIFSSQQSCVDQNDPGLFSGSYGGRAGVTTQLVDAGCQTTTNPVSPYTVLSVKNTVSGNTVTMETWRGSSTCSGTPYSTQLATLGAVVCTADPMRNPSASTSGYWVSVSKNSFRSNDVLADLFSDDKCSTRVNNPYVLHGFATDLGCDSTYDAMGQDYWLSMRSQILAANGDDKLDFSIWIGNTICSGTPTAKITAIVPGTCNKVTDTNSATLFCGATNAASCYVHTYAVGKYQSSRRAEALALLLLICCCLVPLFIVCGGCLSLCTTGGIVGVVICCVCKKKKAAAANSVGPVPVAQQQQIIVVASEPVQAPVVAMATVVA